jgi:O-antigen/teichoic acid export membrane protein
VPYQEEEEEQEEIDFGTHAAKRGIVFVAGQITVALVTLMMLIILARLLQPAEFGIYSIAIAFNGIITIASNFGMGTAFRKMLPEMGKAAKGSANALLSSGYFVAISIGTVIAVVSLLFSSYIATAYYHNPYLALPLQLASISELLTVLFALTQGALVGLGRVKEAAVSNASYAIINFISSVTLVLLGYGVSGAIGGLLIGLSFGAVAGISIMVVKEKFRWIAPKRQLVGKLTSFTAPVVASYVATQGAQNFVVMMLGVYTAASIVGNFGAAYKSARFVELTITSITFVLLGTYSAALARKETAKEIGRIYNSSVRYSALLLFPIIAYLVSVVQPLSSLLFSSQYSELPFFFSVMAIGMGIGIIGIYAGTLIIGHGDTKKYMRYQLLAVAVQILILYLLVPYYGAYGALVAVYAITPMMLNIMYMKLLKKQFGFKQELGKLSRIALASVIVGALMFTLTYSMSYSRWAILVDAVVILLAFPPIAAAINAIGKEDLKFMERTASRLGLLGSVARRLISYFYIFIRE